MSGSKKFKGKQCAYCGTHGCSTDGEHVIARSFFVDEDKLNLVKVPSCRACNAKKELVEDYALAMLSLGNRHKNAAVFMARYFEKRRKKRHRIYAELLSTLKPAYERTPSGIILPTGSINFQPDTIIDFTNYLVKGLYFHHRGRSLPANVKIYNRMFKPDDAAAISDSVLSAMGSNVDEFAADIGSGTLRYWAAISNVHEAVSYWQLSLMGGTVFGVENYAPNLGLTTFYIATSTDGVIPS